MKILSIGNFGHGWDGSICDEENIAQALEDLGHEVIRKQREELPGYMLVVDYDFVLIAQWNGYPETLVEDIKAVLSCPVVYWAFDYQYDKNGEPCPEDWHIRLAQQADVFLSKEMANKAYYDSIGATFRWLPQDFAPEFLDKVLLQDNEYEVVFTGSYLPYAQERTEVLKAVDKQFDLHIFSVTPDDWKREGFKNVHGPIMDHGLPALYAATKINLSIDWKHSMGYWSDRNAQIMCCGGFVLFRYVPLSETVFKDKVAYFYNTEDCLKKIAYYLENEAERNTIAERGYKCAVKHFKVSGRVKEMLTIVGEFL